VGAAQPILSFMKNVSKRISLLLALSLLTLLSACSGGFSASSYAFDVAIDPNPIGYSYDPLQGIYTIPSHILTFNSNAGAVGATIEGYEISYFEASGNPIFFGDSEQRSKGSLNVRVPPGILCPTPEEGAIDNCTVNTPGVVFARGAPAPSQPTFLLPLDVAIQHRNLLTIGGGVGAYAEVTFYGTDDLQRDFVSDIYQFAIAEPVGSE
jgi:hypothetical protein